MGELTRILELRSVRGTGGGPEKTILLGAARTDRSRFSVTVCYIRDLRDPIFHIDQRAQEAEVDYIEIQERHSFDPTIWRALRRLVRDRRIDIVHAHEYKTDLLAWALAFCENIIPLSTAHGWTGHSHRERLYYGVEKRLLARFPRTIAVSSQIKSELVRTGSSPDRVTVILNAIDHRAFIRDPNRTAEIRRLLGYRPNEIVVGAVGRLEPQKRFDLLLKAFAALRAERPQLRLAIVGEGESRRDLESLIRGLGLDEVSHLLGQRSDVVSLHHAFDLFVQSSEYEGTPNVVLEAMALETPIVATDVGGTRELIDHEVHGLLVPNHDVNGLAHAIDRIVDDPASAAIRVANARRRVEQKLSFDVRTQSLEGIYEELIQNRTRVLGSR